MMPKTLREIQNEVKEARKRYRQFTIRYLKLKGKDRKQVKAGLAKAREKFYSLRIREADFEMKETRVKLESVDRNSSDYKILLKKMNRLSRKKNKLLSRLNHDEWLEFTRSVWRFKEMESNVRTAIHPAQFSAEIPRRCIKMYSFVGETVLDPFVGVGTTLAEARKLKRKSIGIDINPKYISFVKKLLQQKTMDFDPAYEPIVKVGDARDLSFISKESIDLIIAHPPYWNAVQTSQVEGDLSLFGDYEYDKFLGEMRKVFIEMERVLKKDRVLVIITGDVIRKIDWITQLFAIHSDYIQMLKEMNFILWNIFIYETKIRKSRGKPTMGSYPFPHKLLSQISHNYVLIFRKLPH